MMKLELGEGSHNWDGGMVKQKEEIPKSTLGKNMIWSLRTYASWGCKKQRKGHQSVHHSPFASFPSSLSPNSDLLAVAPLGLQDPLISGTFRNFVLPHFSSFPFFGAASFPRNPSHILILFGTCNNRPGIDFIQNLEGEWRANELKSSSLD